MKKTFLLSLIVIVLSLMIQCSSNPDISPERAMYYWQTTMNFDKTDDSIANNLKLKTIYIRYFDIDWSPGYKSGIPVGVLDSDSWKNTAYLKDKNIIPTVFITNRTFKNLDDKGIQTLAENTVKKIDQISDRLESWYVGSVVNYDDFEDNYEGYEKARKAAEVKFKTMISEVQIDCDWTASTRDKFFSFLKILKPKLANKTLSCTVRLHQYKDRKLMGIPPVERGLLMCYNVGNVRKFDTKNSILEAEIVKQYLKGDAYPIKLDIGLPMFSWAAWYRGTEFKGIVSNWNELDVADKSLYRFTKDNRYLVSRDTAIGDNYLREGDLLRWDNSSKAEIDETISLLKNNLDISGIRISFFDWETEKIKRHEKALEAYYRQFE